MIKDAFLTSLLILLAIILGIGAGTQIPALQNAGQYVDYLVLALVFLVMADVQMHKIVRAIKEPKVLLIAWLSNFAIIPILGFGLAQLFFADQPYVALGISIYFMSPCTDWFLGFTRMAHGNTALGSVLLPINMLTQFLLYPIWLKLFAGHSIAAISALDIANTLLQWFLLPVGAAIVVRFISIKWPMVRSTLARLTNPVIYALSFLIFAVNVREIIANLNIFLLVLLCVLCFFVVSLAITEAIAKWQKLSHENHVLYTITTSARNAPLMLSLSTVAIADAPLLYATIIIGMLIEFPYLAFHVLRFNARRQRSVVRAALESV